jgi:protein phosphatase 2C
MAEICGEEAKLAPAPTSAAAALARRRPRVEMTVAADQGGKRRRVACAAHGRTGARWWPRYGVTSVRGPRREMEDAVSIRPDFLPGSSGHGKHNFFGVFDGHGCSHVRKHLCT